MQSAELATPFAPRRSTRRDHWTSDEAHRVLADASASGLTLSGYARKHGLREQQLYWWNNRLRTHGDATVSLGVRTAVGKPISFVPIVQVRGPADAKESGVEVAVGAIVVRVGRNFCAHTFAQVLAALGAAPC